MSDLAKFLLKSYLRQLLVAVGVWLLARGFPVGDADSFAAKYVDELLGLLLVGGAAVWAYFYQHYVRRKVVAAKQLPPDASREELEEATAAIKETA